MRFFIDTANIEEIKEANELGVICGVTTNPSLIAKEGRDFIEVVKEISTIVDGPISAEVISLDHKGMVEEIVDIFNVNAIETEIIVASVRNPIHVAQAARMGADIATVPYKVITQMTKHPLTDKGIENFLKDWEGASLKL